MQISAPRPALRDAAAPRPAKGEPTLTSPGQIQGSGFKSPLLGDTVTTAGLVTAVQGGGGQPGFFLQDPQGDGKSHTSDAVYVRAEAKALEKLKIGNQVRVVGKVAEEFGLTSVMADSFEVLAGKTAKIPEARQLRLPSDRARADRYLEAREGMLVGLDNAIVLDPTDKFDSFVVADEKSHGPRRDFDDTDAGKRITVGPLYKAEGKRNTGTSKQVLSGDRVQGVEGPLTYAYGEYAIKQSPAFGKISRGTHPPSMWGDLTGDDVVGADDIAAIKARSGSQASGPLDAADLDADGAIRAADVKLAQERADRVTGGPTFTIAQANVENLFDLLEPTPDDVRQTPTSYQAKLGRVATSIRDHLRAPSVIAVQEVENQNVLADLVARPELNALGYKYALIPGPSRRGINVGMLYRADQVKVENLRQAGLEAKNPILGKVPKTSKELFDRPPLLADLTIASPDGKASQSLTMIVNHFASKFGGADRSQPIREAQAAYVGNLVDKLRGEKPAQPVLVVGDLNDHETSPTLRNLTHGADGPRMANLGVDLIPRGERYTYNHKGKSEMIDHILATPDLAAQAQLAGVRHTNVDLPSSAGWNPGGLAAADHDWMYATFGFGAPAQAAAGAAAVSSPATTNEARS